ncbi:phage tail tape measure protein, partial [bacterium]|nr:phage tail tape measure protein [bacterium]
MKEAGIKIIIDSEEAKRKFNELQGSFKELKKNRDEAFKAGNVDAFKTYDAELKKTGRELKKFERDTISVEKTLLNLNKVSQKDLQKALAQARKEMQGLDRDSAQYAAKKKNFETIRNEVNKVNGSLKDQQGLFGKLSGGFNKYFGMVTAGLASLTGVVMGLKSSIQDAFDFESKLAELSAITGLEGQGLDWLGEKAKELSTTMTVDGVRITKSATEIIDAFKLMGSAKPELLENKEALALVTTEALKLAEAAKMDTSLAVESLANVMNQFGASADEASRYINVLAAGSKAGAADVDSIAKSIVKFGPAADMANISVEESVGLIEALAEKGVKGEIAGTQLKTMLLKLQQGADEFNPKVVGLNTALDNLSKANLSATEMTKMFGMEAFTAGAILINNAD